MSDVRKNPDPSQLPEELREGGTPSEPKPAAIRIGEREFQSQEELAEAYRESEAHRRALETVVGRQGKELGDVREGGARPPEDELGIPKEFFDEFEGEFVKSPAKAMKDFAGKIVATIAPKIEANVLKRTTVDRSIETFWSDYFGRFPKHKEIEQYVRLEGDTMARSGSLNGLNPVQQMDAIATRIERIGTRVFKATVEDVPDRRSISEPGRTPGPAQKGSAKPDSKAKPPTFMEEIRKGVYRKDAEV